MVRSPSFWDWLASATNCSGGEELPKRRDPEAPASQYRRRPAGDKLFQCGAAGKRNNIQIRMQLPGGDEGRRGLCSAALFCALRQQDRENKPRAS